MRLTAAEQAWDHLAQAVGRHARNRQADLGAGLAGGQGLGQVADDQAAGGIGFKFRQTLGVFCQLVAARGQQLGGDDLAAQGRLEKRQGRFRVGQVLAQLRLGTLVHGLGGKAFIAVVHQRLVHHRRQAIAVALLGGTEGVIEVRTLFGPAGDLVQLVMAVCPGGQNAEHQQGKKQTTHMDSCQSATIVRVGRRICREVLSVT